MKTVKPDFFSGFNFTTAMINLVFISSLVSSPSANSHHDQLPVSLIAQLVEHCAGIAEVMGSNPVQAYFF